MNMSPGSPRQLAPASTRGSTVLRFAQALGDFVRAGLVICMWVVLATFGAAATYCCIRVALWARSEQRQPTAASGWPCGRFSASWLRWESSMAKRFNIAPPNVRRTSVILDEDGNVVEESVYEDSMSLLPDGSVLQEKRGTSQQLSDGSVWSPAREVGKEPVHVGICEDCRHPRFRGVTREKSRTGLVALNQAVHCHSCGKLCCPRHATQCADDKMRCHACSGKHGLLQFLKSVFFVREE